MRKKQGKIRNASLAKRYRRKMVIRKKVEGTAEKPRISVCKTNKHLSVQVVNDFAHVTLFSVHTFGKNAVGNSNNKESAKSVGLKIGEQLLKSKISAVVFDRNGYKFTGVIAALADAIKEKGIRI